MTFLSLCNGKDILNIEKAIPIPLEKLFDFPNHPFQVNDDKEMENMVETVKTGGIIMPLVVRQRDDGNYEIISGHRRKRASQLANLKEVPCIIRDLSDDEATIIMVDSNMQRTKILPSEKAKAYKMKLEAEKHQGQRKDLTSDQIGQKLPNKTTREKVAEELGESATNIQRYIRLTELIPELLKLVDEEKMKLRPAVELSYLTKEEQQQVFDAIEYTDAFPSHPQAIKMKKLSENGNLTMEEIDDILEQEKPNQIPKFKIPEDKVEQYIPKQYKSMEEKEDYIVHCVKETSERERKQKQNEYVR